MFNVGRFDPRKEASSSKHKGKGKKKTGESNRKRRRTSSKDDADKEEKGHEKDGSPPDSSLYVIAPEAKGPVSVQRKSGRIEEEAFDDMELDDQAVPTETLPEETEVPKKSPSGKGHTKGTTTTKAEPVVVLPDEIRNALHMASLPIREAADQWNLAPFLVDNLEREGFEHFFPIQALVIPDIIASERYSYIRAQDVCVSAATGSGKTLAFVLPILNALSKRKVKRLRALVVLPSRDLGT